MAKKKQKLSVEEMWGSAYNAEAFKRRKVKTLKIRGKRGILFLGRPSRLSVLLMSTALVLLVFSLVSTSVPLVPMIWYRVKPGTTSRLERLLGTQTGDIQAALRQAQGHDRLGNARQAEIDWSQAYQPPFDPSLPAENRISIASIGLDAVITEAAEEEYETALRVGVWRVPDFGNSFERELPMILAAHRFGYLKWTNAYRRKNSFFNLPKLEPGDQVEIVWNQRKYVYEIYAGEENTEITDYAADLILYTCQYLESDVRIFRYARLVER